MTNPTPQGGEPFMSDQHEGDPRDIEPAYASDDWASRRGYEIAMAWGDSHEHRLGQADDIAHEFRRLRDYMQERIAELESQRIKGNE